MKLYELNIAPYTYDRAGLVEDVPVAVLLKEAVVHRSLNLTAAQMLERLPLVLKLKKAHETEAATIMVSEEEMTWLKGFMEVRGVWDGALMELAVRLSSPVEKEATLSVVEDE